MALTSAVPTWSKTPSLVPLAPPERYAEPGQTKRKSAALADWLDALGSSPTSTLKFGVKIEPTTSAVTSSNSDRLEPKIRLIKLIAPIRFVGLTHENLALAPFSVGNRPTRNRQQDETEDDDQLDDLRDRPR